jgi:PadR family transcriptional regulator, regulatory protein AphA
MKRPSQTSYVILGFLSTQPSLSGYDIRKAVQESVGHFWSESYGQIYPALKRLAAEGLIVPSGPVSPGKRKRQEYSLTEAGRASLRRWLALPFQHDPPRNEFLLKLFFGREAAPGVVASHIHQIQESSRQLLATLTEIEAFVQNHPSQNPHEPYQMLTLKAGVALARTTLDWCESALATLATAGAGAAHPQSPTDKPNYNPA